MVRKSTDMRSGAAKMAHIAIWVLLCSYDNPKLPKNLKSYLDITSYQTQLSADNKFKGG